MTIKYLTFRPLLKQTIWGGNRIAQLKQMSNAPEQVGESWEISGVAGNESIVDGGPFDGWTLPAVIAEMKSSLVGQRNYDLYGTEFPLLIKFIDACQPLSIQVHPNDELAQKHGGKRGKTEMWYIMPSTSGATLYSGLSRQIDAEQYKKLIEQHDITSALALHHVSEGNAFFIPAGRIHSIGAGCMILEIQQTCDLTYRIYDFDRRDKNGQLRELHTQLASECIDYHVYPDYRVHYKPVTNQPTVIVDCPFFTTSFLNVDGSTTIDFSRFDSFVILMAVKGEGALTIDGEPLCIKAGQTLLLPATAQQVGLQGRMTLLYAQNR